MCDQFAPLGVIKEVPLAEVGGMENLGRQVKEFLAVLADLPGPTTSLADAAVLLPDGEGEDAGTVGDVIADPDNDGPVEQASRNELKELILEKLKNLPRAQSKVLALYYGEDLTLREIAEVLGVTESRVCQIHSQAILSIRAYLQRLESGHAGLAARSYAS